MLGKWARLKDRHNLMKYENVPDELLGAYYFETPFGESRQVPSSYPVVGKGLPPGTTTITVQHTGTLYVIAETGMSDDTTWGNFGGGFEDQLTELGWVEVDVGPRSQLAFLHDHARDRTTPTELQGSWQRYYVTGQAHFAWKARCYDYPFPQDFEPGRGYYGAKFLSLWKKEVSAEEEVSIENTQDWVGGLALKTKDASLLEEDEEDEESESKGDSCADLDLARKDATTSTVALPAESMRSWAYYAGSTVAGAQAIFYTAGDGPRLLLLDEDDKELATAHVSTKQQDDASGVKFTLDGAAVVVTTCANETGTIIMTKYAVPELTQLWRNERSSYDGHSFVCSIASDHLAVGKTRYVYHGTGFKDSHQFGLMLGYEADDGIEDGIPPITASHSLGQAAAFNPDSPWNSHLLLSAGDANPKKLQSIVYAEPFPRGHELFERNNFHSDTDINGHHLLGTATQSFVETWYRTHFGAVVPQKEGGGFAVAMGYTGDPGYDAVAPKVFFGTLGFEGFHETCMKPVFGDRDGTGQLAPTLVALSWRKFLLMYTKVPAQGDWTFLGNWEAMGRSLPGNLYDEGSAQTEAVIVDVYGQIHGEIKALPQHPIGKEVRHLEQTSKGISWIQMAKSGREVHIHRIACKPVPGGGVSYPDGQGGVQYDEGST